jgi:hypothetical protein
MSLKDVESIIPQRINETQKAYYGRKIAFVKVFKKTNGDINKSIKFSNIWANTEFMKCTYDPKIMEELNSYM